MRKLLAQLAQYNKAFVPVVVAGALALLAQVGVDSEMSVKDAVTAVITSAVVWFVPNKNKEN